MAKFYAKASELGGSPVKLETSKFVVIGWDVRTSGQTKRRAEAYFDNRDKAMKMYDTLELTDEVEVVGPVVAKAYLITTMVLGHLEQADAQTV